MTRFFSPRIFTLVASLVYVFALTMSYPMFKYYPLVDIFTREDLPGMKNGPAMNWYGWMAYAFVAGIVVSLIFPKKLDDKIPAVVFWIVPLVVLAGGFYVEGQWFLK